MCMRLGKRSHGIILLYYARLLKLLTQPHDKFGYRPLHRRASTASILQAKIRQRRDLLSRRGLHHREVRMKGDGRKNNNKYILTGYLIVLGRITQIKTLTIEYIRIAASQLIELAKQ